MSLTPAHRCSEWNVGTLSDDKTLWSRSIPVVQLWSKYAFAPDNEMKCELTGQLEGLAA